MHAGVVQSDRPSCVQTEFRYIRAPGNWVRLVKIALYKVWNCHSQLSFTIRWQYYRSLWDEPAAAADQEDRDIAKLAGSLALLSLDDHDASRRGASSVGSS